MISVDHRQPGLTPGKAATALVVELDTPDGTALRHSMGDLKQSKQSKTTCVKNLFFTPRALRS